MDRFMKRLMNLEETADFLGCHVGDVLLAFFKHGFPSPLFDREEVENWVERVAPEVTDEDQLKSIYRELHAEGLEPMVYDDGERRGILVWEGDDDEKRS